MQIVTFFLFTGLVGLVTWYFTRRDDHSQSSANYFLAGRALSFGVIAGSLLLTNLSTEQLVGLNGAAFTDGFVVMAWEVIAAMSLVVMAWVFLPYYLRSGIATVPQFFEQRFGPTTRTITTLIFIVAYAAILLPIILYTGATGLIGMLDVEAAFGIEQRTTALWIVVWIIGVIGSIYAIFGGLRTVAISDTLNGIGLLIGGMLVTFLALRAVGDGGGALAGFTTLVQDHPDKFDSVGTAEQSVPFSTIFTGVLLLNLFYWCTNQQIIQRTFAAPSLAEGQKGVLLAGWIKVTTPLILIVPGIAAFHLFAEDGIDADDAYGTLVREVLPVGLTGFFAAVVVGAVLSSFNSALNSCATLFSYGVFKGMIRKDADDAAMIRAGKYFGGVIAIAAMIFAPLLHGQESIFQYLQHMNAIYFIPLFAVVIVAIAFRRVPGIAANIALILGCLIIGAGYFVPWLYDNIVEPMNEFHFVGAVFAGLIVLMLAIGSFRPLPEPWQQTYSGDVEMTPWRHAWLVGGGLIALVVTIYIVLAFFP